MVDGSPEFFHQVQLALAALIADPSPIVYCNVFPEGVTIGGKYILKNYKESEEV